MVCLPPMLCDHSPQPCEPALGDRIDLMSVDQESVSGERDLPIHIQLILEARSVAEVDRLRAAIPGKAIMASLRRRRATIDIVEDVEFGPCQARRVEQPS